MNTKEIRRLTQEELKLLVQFFCYSRIKWNIIQSIIMVVPLPIHQGDYYLCISIKEICIWVYALTRMPLTEFLKSEGF